MFLLLLLLILVILFTGVGFAFHLLWIAAIIALVILVARLVLRA